MPTKRTDFSTTIICACGCGEEILLQDNRGRERKYAKGHQAQLNKSRKIQQRDCYTCGTTKSREAFMVGQQIRKNCKDCASYLLAIAALQRKYGVTEKEAISLYGQTVCEICGSDQGTNTDHDHETGEVRGKLCWRCNTTIGRMEDSPDLLIAAAMYLLKAKGIEVELQRS